MDCPVCGEDRFLRTIKPTRTAPYDLRHVNCAKCGRRYTFREIFDEFWVEDPETLILTPRPITEIEPYLAFMRAQGPHPRYRNRIE